MIMIPHSGMKDRNMGLCIIEEILTAKQQGSRKNFSAIHFSVIIFLEGYYVRNTN
jgi:hypothetical protein